FQYRSQKARTISDFAGTSRYFRSKTANVFRAGNPERLTEGDSAGPARCPLTGRPSHLVRRETREKIDIQPMRSSRITIANGPDEIRRCHLVMRELRPLFQEPEQFVERVQRQQKEGYQLAFLESENEVCAVTG